LRTTKIKIPKGFLFIYYFKIQKFKDLIRMGKLSVFEDLPIWQEARLIAKDIYSITANDLFSKDFRFVSQIRSASGSIMDNIAEGFERDVF